MQMALHKNNVFLFKATDSKMELPAPTTVPDYYNSLPVDVFCCGDLLVSLTDR